jgi:hypothetical protein
MELFSIDGMKVATIYSDELLWAGNHTIELSRYTLLPGVYISRITSEGKSSELYKLIVQ